MNSLISKMTATVVMLAIGTTSSYSEEKHASFLPSDIAKKSGINKRVSIEGETEGDSLLEDDLIPVLPSDVRNVSASDGADNNTIVIAWARTQGADYYKIGKSLWGWISWIDTNVGDTIFSYSTTPGQSFTFAVAACNDVGCSAIDTDIGSTSGFTMPELDIDRIPELTPIDPEPIDPEPIDPEPEADEPEAEEAEPAVLLSPTGLSASDGEFADRVEITFNAAAGAASYWVFRSDELFGMDYRSITRTSSTSFVDTTAVPGVQYYYAATSCDADGVCTEGITPDGGYAGVLGEGAVEEEDEVVDEAVAPTVPDRITTSRGVYEDKVEIAISEVDNATQYEIYRTTDASSMGTKLGSTAETITNDNTVTSGINYFYRVKACNDAGCSDFTMADRGFAQALESEPERAVEEIEETVLGLLVSQESYMIGGSFGRHDFAGVESSFDWAFTTPRGSSFQLQGIPATSGDVFGWAAADIPTPTPAWYMFALNVDIDDDGTMKFDWILASTDMNNKMVFKLSGVSGTGEFLYSDRINVNYSISNGEIFFTTP
ncbi:MAG: hypothetical protein U9P71_04865 [Campylobacterota bacterium]|nr:hypothetical protein [Campylobacterota bacterium]